MSSTGPVTIESRFPSDVEMYTRKGMCPHCGMANVRGGACIACGCEVCQHGQELRACVACSGEPLLLKKVRGSQ